MNIMQKFTVAALLTGFALASNPARADVLGFSVTLPGISTVTAEVGKIVAADLTASLRKALSEPRMTRTRQSPSVTITEVVETGPMETVTVVATRLPPVATETLAQANTRTRL